MTHQILNYLNNITVIAGALRDDLKANPDLPADYLKNAIENIESAALKAAKDLEELRSKIRESHES